jgi:hypothetical protein
MHGVLGPEARALQVLAWEKEEPLKLDLELMRYGPLFVVKFRHKDTVEKKSRVTTDLAFLFFFFNA